jgi:hypothetical protein
MPSFTTMPTLLSLAALKAFAFEHREKWKDYIDIYFIQGDYFTIEEISVEAKSYSDNCFLKKYFVNN